MRLLFFLTSLLSLSSSAQSSFEVKYSQAVCNCLEGLKPVSEIKITEQNLMECFEKALHIDTALILREAMAKYGDTSYATGYRFVQEMLNQTTISLVKDCKAYFLLTDSLRYQDYKNLKTDSLKRQLTNSYRIKPSLLDDNSYSDRANLWFCLKLYDSSLINIERSLKRNPNNIQSLYLKAWIKELRGDYDEAILLYDKVAAVSKSNSFYIFSAVAKRKKSGM